MNTTSKNPTDLCTTLRGSLVAANVLCTSTKVKDADLLQNIIYNLHAKRKEYPNCERLISQVIFKIHDKTFSRSSDFMRQKAHIATICGFSQTPTQNMAVAKELLNRIPLVEKPKNMLAPLQAIMEQTTNLYAAKNYQQKDTNKTVAYKLKALIIMLAPYAKTQPDKQQIYDCANTLERVQPVFKGFAQQYAFTPKKRATHICIKEAVDIFARPAYGKRGGIPFSRDE